MIENVNLPSDGRQDASQQAQERRFARAIWSDEGRHASCGDLQRDIPERISAGRAFTKGLAQVPDDNCIHVNSPRMDGHRLHEEDCC
jgi:hypothetical protein